MLPDRLQYFFNDFWNFENFVKNWTRSAPNYYQNATKDTRKIWEHPGNILFVSICGWFFDFFRKMYVLGTMFPKQSFSQGGVLTLPLWFLYSTITSNAPDDPTHPASCRQSVSLASSLFKTVDLPLHRDIFVYSYPCLAGVPGPCTPRQNMHLKRKQ